MKNTINNNVQEINRNIIHIDTSSNYRTPYYYTADKANVPIKTAGTRKRYYYFKLAGGIHPTEELNFKIKKRFLKAIDEKQKDGQMTTQMTILTMNPRDFGNTENDIR